MYLLLSVFCGKKRFVILSLCLLGVLVSEAQEVENQDFVAEEINAPPRFLVGANFLFLQPLRDFRANLNTEGIGASASAYIRVNQKIPVYVGLELSGLVYDRAFIEYVDEVDGFLAQLKEETAPSIFMGHLIFRLEPPVNFFAYPFFEGIIGFKNLFTRTKVKDVELDEDAVLSNILEEGDWAFSYGFAAGLSIPIGNHLPTIDLKCAYLIGNAANYLVRRTDIVGVPGRPIDVFELKNSTTDLLLPQIGITFAFGR
jgi:hypothetical protein